MTPAPLRTQSTRAFPFQTAILVEAMLVALAAAAIFAVIYTNAGGPLGSDSLGYLNAAINNLKSTHITNRYTYIFLLKLFVVLSHTPLAGARLGTSLVLGSAVVLIYLAARLFTPRSTPLQGTLAAVLFLATPAINGDPLQMDLTAMTMGLAMVVAYLISSRQEHRRPWLLILTGFLFYVSYRAKETTLPLGMILLGLGFAEQRFDLRRLAKRLAWVVAGILAGVLFFIALNTFILGDPWFGIRLADLTGPLAFYKATGPVGASTQDWFTGYIFSNMPILFVLYLLGALLNRQWKTDQWLVWLAPLLMVEFLNLTTAFGTFDRYFFPTLPVLCFLGAQVLEFDPTPVRRWWVWVGAGLLLILVLEGIPWVLVNQRWFSFLAIQSIHQQVALPVSFAILLAVLAIIRQFSLKTVWIPLVCLGMILVMPLQKNYEQMTGELSPRIQVSMRFYPITTFKRMISLTTRVKILVSNDMTDPLEINQNRDELAAIFNVATRSNLIKTNFNFVDSPDQLAADIQLYHANYVLLARAYWKAAAGQTADRKHIESLCQTLWSDDQKYILLTCFP
jgi:hypothetical protein